jgi:hypothetical protein
VGSAVAVAIFTLASHHFEGQYWVRWAILCVIFTTGFSLSRHLPRRRNTIRTPGKD